MAPRASAVDQVLQLKPEEVLAEGAHNVRFGPLNIEDMKTSIENEGGVQQPIIVAPLDPAVNGFKYRLTTGFRRHQAVSELNKEKGVGLTIPAIVRPVENDLDRLTQQLVENVERKSMSPMDTAVALKKLMDAGLTRIQIREKFPRAIGKGKVEPASNAWLNMTLSFLDLPKPIQQDIHTGVVGVKAAYELTKVTPEKRAAVIERAKADAEKDRAKEEADEQKYLATESKLAEVTKAAEDTAVKMDEARAEVELAEKAWDIAVKDASALHEKAMKAKKDDKKKAEEAYKAKETEAKAAEKTLEAKRKELKKLKEAQTKANTKAEEFKAKLEAARAEGAKGKKKAAVTQEGVRKAAQAEGAPTGHVQLNAAQMREVIKDLSLPGSYPKVAMIGGYIKECFDGVTTPGQMLKKLASVTGELDATPKKKK
jgi:ParB/RepB/Spo0J family partition protein